MSKGARTDSPRKLTRTGLFESHVSLGARMVEFAGWEMPIQYASILDEVRSVRSGAGLFDVSHMGRIHIQGPGAAGFLDAVLGTAVAGLRTGRARYSLICNLDGGILDDAILYRTAEERFLLIPNASNRALVLEWLSRWAPEEDLVRIEDATENSVMLAHQGPDAAGALQELTSADLGALRRFRATETTVAGLDVFVSRTGYTGEDGFELIVAASAGADVWTALVDTGAVPCGLGARDILRLEAGLSLHGMEIDVTVDPYEAGLDRFVDPDRESYVAGEALRRIRDRVVSRRLVGFNLLDRGIPRSGFPITDGVHEIGRVTSGGHSPSLDRSIGLGYVRIDRSSIGSRLQIDIRGRSVEAEVTVLPFYSRRRSA